MHKTILTVFLTLVGVGIVYAAYTILAPGDDVSNINRDDIIFQPQESPINDDVIDVKEPDLPEDPSLKKDEPETLPPVTKEIVDRQAIARGLITQQTCESAGGTWKRGFSLEYFCVLPTSDAGDACTDSSQCESWCQAPKNTPYDTPVTGTCFGFTHASCGQEVNNGIAGGEWCE